MPPRRWPKYFGLALAALVLGILVFKVDLPLPTQEPTRRKTSGADAESRQAVLSTSSLTATHGHPTIPTESTDTPTYTTTTIRSDQRTGFGAITASSGKTADSAVRDISTWLTVISDGVTLRGTLNAEAVEFFLRRKDQKVFGVVRYLNANGERVAANTVSGEIVGRTLTLSEKSRIWTRINEAVASNDPFWEIGRGFVITLPDKHEAQILTGTWSIGHQTGTLLLSPATPW